MAFLDNSGDIILDAVLTDNGRKLLAKGDGSFRIAKFALCDDEIDYSLFVTATGSAYTDLSIMQTPILEAFTNNGSSMKSTLLSISDQNLLYLSKLELNELAVGVNERNTNGAFTVACTKDTENNFVSTTNKVMFGFSLTDLRYVRIDSGIDDADVSSYISLDAALDETQFMVTMDNRFGQIVGKSGTTPTVATLAFIDDDDQAHYICSGGNFVTNNTVTDPSASTEVIAGPRGNILKFRILTSLELRAGSLFSTLGASVSMTDSTTTGTNTYNYIDSNISVKGLNMGYQINIPVRFIKLP